MKLFRTFSVGLLLTVGLIAGFCFLHAQDTATASTTPDSIVQLTADADGLNLVPAVPTGGTFWIVTAEGVSAPWPLLPPNDQGLPVFCITNEIFLVDATYGQVDMQALGATNTAEALEIMAGQVENVITHTLAAVWLRP